MEEILEMNAKELERLHLLKKVLDVELKQIKIGKSIAFWIKTWYDFYKKEDKMTGISISIYSNMGHIDRALKKIAEKEEEYVDRARMHINRYTVSGNLNIETQLHFSDPYSRSLFPQNGRVPDLIFVFSQAVGISKTLKTGDMVLVAPQNGPSLAGRLSHPDIRSEIEGAFSPLKAVPFDYNHICSQVLLYLDEANPKDPKDIARYLHIPDEHFQRFFQKVMRPHARDEKIIQVPPEKAYWQRDSNYNFYLTPIGLEAKRALTSQPSSERKVSLVTGESYCSPHLIRSHLPDGARADVIDQMSALTFAAIRGEPYASRTLHVCVVKCLEGGDIEEESPYADSVAETIVKLVLAVSQKLASKTL